MTTTEYDLQQFTEFARQRLHASAEQPSLVELMDLWQLEHPTEAEHAENVAAVNAAISDFKNGDRGRPAGELSRELRARLTSQ